MNPNAQDHQQAQIPEMDLWAGDEFSLNSAAKPQVAEQINEANSRKTRFLIYGIVLALLAAGYYYFTTEGQISEELVEAQTEEVTPNQGIHNEVATNDPAALALPIQNNIATGEITPSSPSEKNSKGIPLNPYWSLPNELDTTDGVGMGTEWGGEDEDKWREGISHEFNYQRYKTVLEVAEAKLAGSEVILWEALSEPKLWIRMRAIMALADFGIPVNFENTEKALGTAESSAINRFLQRFVEKNTAGERFMIRQVIRLLDENGRIIALKALKSYPSELRDIYMTAAKFDSSAKVRKWAQFNLPQIKPDHYIQYKKIVLGQAAYTYKYANKTEIKSQDEKVESHPDETTQDEGVEVESMSIYDLSGKS